MPMGKSRLRSWIATPNMWQTAVRPWFIEVEASAGKPMTSPTA